MVLLKIICQVQRLWKPNTLELAVDIFIDIGEIVSNFNAVNILQMSPTNLNVTEFYSSFVF